MVHFTSNTYTLKRKILTFTNKISKQLSKPERKFTADITYGMLASGSCLLTDVVDQLYEDSKKINVVDRLSRHLNNGTPTEAVSAYLQQIKKWIPAEACVLTTSNHPVSIFSKIHSSTEKDYKSANTITFDAMKQGASLFGKATFCMDRGYDDNKMFLKLDALNQDYVIRLKSKEDVIKVARTYFSRWKIEEYFRCKKQMFQFENFRVRKLRAINALNFYITLCMVFLAIISMESETSAVKVSIIKSAAPVKKKVHFCYYRLAKGIRGILSYAKEGVRLWFRTKRPAYRQIRLNLVV